MGEASATTPERPAGRGCCRLDTGEPCKGLDRFSPQADKIELAAAFVGAVASVRSQPGPLHARTTAAWLELEKRLEAVTIVAEAFGLRIPRIRDLPFAHEVAHGLDSLLRHISGGYDALELALCEGLAALEAGRRVMHLGYSHVGDYAQEELGLNSSTAAKKARLGRRLADRPLVREAIRRGDLTPRKAEIIVPLAVGDKQTLWILRAKEDTVRRLKKEVNAPRDPDDEELMTATFVVAAEGWPVIAEGLRWGGIVLGHRSKKPQRVEAWGQEYFGAHPAPPDDGTDSAADDERWKLKCDEEMDSLMEQLERESLLWANLAAVDPLQAIEFSGETDPFRIDAELKQVMEMRDRFDDVFGRVAMLFKRYGAWHALEFTSFGHYCEERLGMAWRTVAQRLALERALCRIPLLREALREKRITYEKARVIARHIESGHAREVQPLIAMAETKTCVDLREALEVEAEGQMCARGVFSLTAPPAITDLLKDAFRMVRSLAKRSISAGKCLAEMAAHFVAVWKAHVKETMTRRSRILARDRHRCQVPGCSRPAVHLHHIEFRSHGGSDDDSNQISLCAAHHLYGIHGGLMRVTGTAPKELVWEFGLRRSWAQTAVP